MTKAAAETLNDWNLRVWGIPLVVLSGLMGLMFFYFPGRWDLFGWYLIASLVYVTITWEIGRWIILRVRRSWPGLDNTWPRIWRILLFSTMVTGLAIALVKVLLYQFGLKPPSLSNLSFFKSFLINFSANLFFIILLCTIYEAVYFFEQYKNAHHKAEKLKRQHLQQQLDTLKNRVNPHFLFNSLTTLSALIGENARLAERFVDELSKVYRYLLRAGAHPRALVREELQFAESYTFLLKNRFECDAFFMAKAPDLDPCLDAYIPVLSLQNVLDYLVRTQNVPLHITIHGQAGYLKLMCDDQPKMRAFDLPDNDWLQLEGQGATQYLDSGKQIILIPFTANTPSQ